MIPSWLGRRNRFKRKTGPQRSGPRWPWLRIDWRSHGRKVAILLLVVASLGALSWALNRPVQVISMDGSFQRVSPGQIEQAVAPYLSSGFMSANLDQIEHAVERIPWVDHARVQRRWPMSLHVTVVEQTAAARWGDSGLLNTRGELFDRAAAHVPSELPRLSGPAGTETEVAQEYLSAAARMSEAGLRIAALRLDERGAWELDLDSGITVRLGRRDVDARLDRFIHTAAPVISHRANDVNYVDMRYSNGFAIGWRSAATPPSTPPKGTEEFNG
jgi:cell division protein FtsQ